MPNKEKVIKGLEHCIGAGSDCRRKCPYGTLPDWNCFFVLRTEALKLLKQEPIVLDLAEVDSPNPEIGLWLEDRGHKGDVMLVLYNGGVDEDMEFHDETGKAHYRDSYDYGILWRCWTAKPTYKQRKAAEWDD